MTSLFCLCCSTPAKPRRAPDGYRTCDNCSDRIREALQETPAQYTRLTTVRALLPQVGEQGRRGPGFGSRSPARDIVIAVTDWRTTWAEDSRLHHPPSVLNAWASLVREEVGEAAPVGPVDIVADAALLVRRLDHATRQPWIGELWRELREVRDQLRTIGGEPRPTPIGRCPAIQEGETEPCNTPLSVRQRSDLIRCRGCGEKWPRECWQLLGKTIGVLT